MTNIITEKMKLENSKLFKTSFDDLNSDISSGFEASLEALNTSESLSLSNTNVEAITGFVNSELAAHKPDDSYYVFAAEYIPENVSTGISNNQRQFRNFSRTVLFGKKIEVDDIRHMFIHRSWVTGTVYTSFDDTIDNEVTNSIVTVLDGDLGTGPYKVFKCLRNNNEELSTIQPSTADLNSNNEAILGDGYVWKYMFDVPATEYDNFGLNATIPFVANSTVSDSAVESISDIKITQAKTSQFNSFIIGTANTTTDSIETSTIESIVIDDVSSNTYKVVIKTSVDPRTTTNAYGNMYLRFIDPGIADSVYDITNSDVSVGTSKRLNIYVQSDVNIATQIPSLAGGECDIVPKIEVTKNEGTRAIAFGDLDSNGTLKYVQFANNGTGYKFADATLKLPSAIEDDEGETLVRPVVSPIGGHGSNPKNELFMSKLSMVTEFDSSVPETGEYSIIGLVKNPEFTSNTSPAVFDNRVSVVVSGDIDDDFNVSLVGKHIHQTVDDENVTATIHNVDYDSDADETTLSVFATSGSFSGFITSGEAEIKSTNVDDDSAPLGTITINNVGSKNYIEYTGQLFHMIDVIFGIQRDPEVKEKIKFVFDF